MTSFPVQLVDAFDESPFSDARVQNVLARRQQMNGLLFDLLASWCNTEQLCYPPRPFDLNSVRTLVQTIEELQSPLTQCLLYYVYLFFPSAGDEVSAHYAEQTVMPKAHQSFVRALWTIDQGSPQVSLLVCGTIENLVSSARWAELTSKILSVLSPSKKVEYMASAKVVASVKTQEQCLGELCTRHSLDGALALVRTMPPDTHAHGYTQVVSASLKSKRNAWRLASMSSHSKSETSHINRSLRALSSESGLARDILLVRLIHCGQLHMVRELVQSTSGVCDATMHWSEIVKGLEGL